MHRSLNLNFVPFTPFTDSKKHKQLFLDSPETRHNNIYEMIQFKDANQRSAQITFFVPFNIHEFLRIYVNRPTLVS